MTDATTQAPEGAIDFDILNPETWKEPKESYPGEVVAFSLRWSRPEYNGPTQFGRPAFPMRKYTAADGTVTEHNSIKQLDIRVKRLDAVYVHEDGSPFVAADGTSTPTAPVIVYSTCDMEKLDQKTMTLKPIAKTRGKEQRIISEWIKLVGPLTPAMCASLIGQKFQFDFFRELEIFKGLNPATRVLLPTAILAPTYAYAGETQKFKASNRDMNDAAVASASQAGFAGAGALSPEEAAQKIGEFLKANGVTSASADVLSLPNFPVEARIEPLISAIALGNGDATLAQFGVNL